MFTRLSALLGLAALARFIPGTGPIIAVAVEAVGKFLAWLVKTLFDGSTNIVSNFATLVTVGVIAMIFFAGGMKTMKEWADYRVERADARVEKITKDMRNVDDEAKRDVTNAIAARKQAEAEAEESGRRATEASSAADAIAAAAAAGQLRATSRAAGARSR